MRIRARKVLRSFLLMVLATLSPTLAQAADGLATDPNTNLVPGGQSQAVHPVTDARQPPPPHAPKGITFDPILVREINSNQALLEHQKPRLKDELAKLKQAGNLDRKIKRDIEASLREAHSILSDLQLALQSAPLDKWQARNIAQALNSQGDNLDASLNEWQKDLSATGKGAPSADSAQHNALQEQRQLIQVLSDISRMLHDTGKAIVRQAQ